MALQTQRDAGRDAEYDERANQTHRERAGGPTAVGLSTFPVATNEGCCSTRLGADQVTGSDGPREICRLGQVASEVARGREGGVSTGCGCGPHGHASIIKEKGQPPLGVDAGDRAPLDSVLTEWVSNDDSLLGDLQSGTPECCVEDNREESVHGEPASNIACCGGRECCCKAETEHANRDRGEDSPRAGHEGRHENNAGMKAVR